MASNRVKIRKDSDDDIDIERPSSLKPARSQSPTRKRRIVEAQLIKEDNESETIYRDRSTGRKIDLKLEKIEKRRAEERDLEIKQQYQQWGRGLKQLEDKAKKAEEEKYEMSKPLNRYADDKDLEDYLKTQQRADDPMFEYLNKKKQKKQKAVSSNTATDSTNNRRPKYTGPMCEPNRFGILPGHRWDGVDRSNGFERKRFKCIAERKALDYESYKWDVEEM